MKIVLLEEKYEQKYEEFVTNDKKGSLYASLKYKKMLELLLGDQAYYFIALNEDDQMIGILPSFLKENQYGNVLNSLPFYGSNGAVMAINDMVREQLLQAFVAFAREKKCVSSTMITSPFESSNEWYVNTLEPDFVDVRIGQITFFPKQGENLDDTLFFKFHKMVRRCIHKAQKSEITVKVDNTRAGWDFLYRTHQENMGKIGGLSKKKEFFEIVPAVFHQKKDYDIYVASMGEVKVAALLIFYYNKTVEYFTPVTVEEYRTYQPLSLIIFQAMQDAIKKGYEKWNWGGTWLDQNGVYDFKRKWGTTDLKYYYFTNINDQSILEWSRDKIGENYQNYYLFPFSGGIDYFEQEESQ